MDLYDQTSQSVLENAGLSARKLGHPQVRPEHMLVGLLTKDTPAGRVLAGYGLTAGTVSAYLSSRPPVPAEGPGLVDPALRDALTREQRAAQEAGRVVDATAVLRATLASPSDIVTELLTRAHVTREEILQAVTAHVPTQAHTHAPASETAAPGTLPAALAPFAVDMVAQARAGKLGTVHGRTGELARLQTVLARRSKNNAVLVGEPGVGKTAVVEGLAAAVAAGTCVQQMAGRPILALDVAGMIAGTSARGAFEQRFRAAIAAAIAMNAVLFIDELHQVVGAGSRSGALDAANMLKESLARGDLSVIGATTLEEYRKHIEADPALERRFAPVRVEPPTVTETTAILRSLRPGLTAHHKARFTDAACDAAARLTDRYVTGRHLPDKAIDALDEAGAAAAMAVARAGEPVRALYGERARVRERLAAAVASEDYEAAGRLAARDKDLTTRLTATGPDLGLVDAEQVAAVVARMSGVPVTAVTEDDTTALAGLGDTLKARVIGQDHAVDIVTAAVRRRRILGADRPCGLLFAGPTGVGKTELAKALAEQVFTGAGTAGGLVRFDMSEFAEKQSVARLVGAPPGYVGHDDGGELTRAVTNNPHCVVLLDEVDKAHPDVFDILLQVLEDGRLTDSTGKVVSFTDTIVILTCNLGSGLAARGPVGFTSAAPADAATAARARVREAIAGHFRPELLNRLDHVVVFDQLTAGDLDRIADAVIARPVTQLTATGVRVVLTTAARARIVAEGYDPVYGARPLRRAVTRLLENPLADAVLSGNLVAGTCAVVDDTGAATLSVAVAADPVAVEALEDALAR